LKEERGRRGSTGIGVFTRLKAAALSEKPRRDMRFAIALAGFLFPETRWE
jgi:hypothetical protein